MGTGMVATAVEWQTHGYTVIPTKGDGSKAPGLHEWRTYINGPQPTLSQVVGWATTAPGIGVVTGTGMHLEMLEVEGRAIDTLAEVAQLCADNGMGDAWTRVATGLVERSPSGGIHLHLRTSGPARPNLKLARTPERVVLWETRGHGGFTVVAPSGGPCHPSGRPWERLTGSVAGIPLLTIDERDGLYAVLGMLDQTPTPATPATHQTTFRTSGDPTGTRPGDVWAAATDWADILPPGWTRVRRMGDGWAWRRPGKREGISATTGQAGDGVDRLWVFSTSTEFPSEEPVTKFHAYSLLHHSGDHRAAAAELARAGYGTPSSRPTLTVVPTPAPAAAPAVDGATALDPEPEPDPEPGPSAHWAPAETTEDAVAVELVTRIGDRVRHVTDTGRWRHLNPATGLWETDPTIATQATRELCRTANTTATFRARLLSARGVRAVTELAAADPRIATTSGAWDQRGQEIAHPDGTTTTISGEQVTRHPTRPEALHTRATRWAPGDTGRARWEEFLGSVLDAETAAYLARLAGLTLLGEVREHVIVFLHGAGANGKSTFMEALTWALGGYAVTLPAETLMARNADPHPTEIARLAGARMAVASELSGNRRFDEERVKWLTGGDTLSARFLYGQPFDFKPTHTLWMTGNNKPAVTTGGESFWRRMRLIDFGDPIPADQRDPDLKPWLHDHAGPGILQWAIDGLADYLKNGIREPETVKASTAEYAAENDTVARFLADCAIVTPAGSGQRTLTSKVREAYEAWCREDGSRPANPTRLGLDLKRAGIVTEKANGHRFYRGLTIPYAVTDGGDQSWQ